MACILARISNFFQSRYQTPSDLLVDPTYRQERNQTLRLAKEELHVAAETEKSLDDSLAKFQKLLEGFQEKKKFVVAEQMKYLQQLRDMEKETPTIVKQETLETTTETSEITETTTLMSTMDSNLVVINDQTQHEAKDKEPQNQKTEEQLNIEAQMRNYLRKVLYTEIGPLIDRIDNSIYLYEEEIKKLELRRDQLVDGRADLEEILDDAQSQMDPEVRGMIEEEMIEE